MSRLGRSPISRRGFLFSGLACLAAPVFAQCRRTPSDALGPYYVPVTGIQPDLCQRDAGSGIVISGRVVGFPDCRPVTDALIEVWHADAYGGYSRVGNTRPDDAACLLRANVRSGDWGQYSFRTVIPGIYTGRPQHIHFRVSAPGHRTLVTQMYFPPQEGIDPRLLARASKPHASGAATFEFNLAIAPD